MNGRKRLGVHGTPTIMINGWLFPGVRLDVDELEEAILAALRGEDLDTVDP